MQYLALFYIFFFAATQLNVHEPEVWCVGVRGLTQCGISQTCYRHKETHAHSHTRTHTCKLFKATDGDSEHPTAQRSKKKNQWSWSPKCLFFFLSSKINQPNAFHLRKADHWILLTVVWVHPCVQQWPFTYFPLPVWAGSRHCHCKGQHVCVCVRVHMCM